MEGRLRIDSFENAEGEKKKVVEVVAQSVQFLGGAPRSAGEPATVPPPEESSTKDVQDEEEVPF